MHIVVQKIVRKNSNMFTYGFYVGNRYIVSVLSRNLILILLYKIQFLIFFLWLLLSFTDIHFPSFNINGIFSEKTQQHGSNRITIENEDELRHHKGFLLLNISAKWYASASNKWIIILRFRFYSPDKTCSRLRTSKFSRFLKCKAFM